jgi:hypothetical protein
VTDPAGDVQPVLPPAWPVPPPPSHSFGREPSGDEGTSARATIAQSAVFVLIATAVGAALAVPLGWVWVALADPPSVPMGARGISYGEEQMNALTAVPGWFVVIGLVVGIAGGAAITIAGRRFGWVVVVATLGFTLAAAAVTRYAGVHWFGPDVRDQLRHSHRGDLIQLDVRLGTRGPLLVWPMGGLAAIVVIVATIWPRSRESVMK